MRPGLRAALLAALGIFAVAGGYRVVAHTVADQKAASDPEAALRWIPDHPEALLQLAERQLAAGRLAEARGTARRLQHAAPLEGRGFRVEAQVALAEKQPDKARELFTKALALSPRDLPARAWLIQDLLVRGQYENALDQIDRVLRYSPQQASVLMPVMARMAQDPRFAASLVPVLARRPPWREAMLREIQGGEYPLAADQVLGELRKAGGLTPEEHARWVEILMRQGHWPEAYARWASTLPRGAKLSPVFNGGFELPITQRGFDWRVRPVPGVSVTFEPTEGATGQAAHIVFRNRRIAMAGLEQALLLPTGAHTLSVRVRAEGLRTDRGLEWQVYCDRGRVLSASERIQGTFGWRTISFRVEVPANCPGQWLRLRNPAPAGTAQYASGDVWIDHVALTSALE